MNHTTPIITRLVLVGGIALGTACGPDPLSEPEQTHVDSLLSDYPDVSYEAFDAVGALEGDVSASGAMNILGSTMHVGPKDWFGWPVDHRGILTFDVSGIPASANIVLIYLQFEVDQLNCSSQAYFDNVVFDLAPFGGFSQTAYVVNPASYYGLAASTTRWVPALVAGQPMLYEAQNNPSDWHQRLHRAGLNQIRMRFSQNLEGCTLDLQTSEGSKPIQLVVAWQE